MRACRDLVFGVGGGLGAGLLGGERCRGGGGWVAAARTEGGVVRGTLWGVWVEVVVEVGEWRA